MVRNVKKQAGFALVEVIVSLVIMSIVALLAANMLTLVTKSQARSSESSDGYLIAKQKLQQMHDTTVMVADGNDTVVQHGKSYYRSWVVDVNTTPYRVDVVVEWTGHNDMTRRVDFSGFLASSNICVDIASNNVPDSLEMYQYGDAEYQNKDTIVFNVATDGSGGQAGTNLVRLVGVDPDITLGDIVVPSIDGGIDEDKLRLTGSVIQLDTTLTQSGLPVLYAAYLNGEDCKGSNIPTARRDTIYLRFEAGALVDTAWLNNSSPINISVKENWTNDSLTMPTLDFGATGALVTLGGLPSSTVNQTTGVMSLIGMIDYETNATPTDYTVTVTSGDSSVTGTINLTVQDVNEPATGATATNSIDSLPDGQTAMDIGTFTIDGDPDGTSAWSSYTISMDSVTVYGDSSISTSDFSASMTTDNGGKLRLTSVLPSEEDTTSFTVWMHARGVADNTHEQEFGLTFYKIGTGVVTGAGCNGLPTSSGGNGSVWTSGGNIKGQYFSTVFTVIACGAECSSKPAWVSKALQYDGGSVVSYGNKVYYAMQAVAGNILPTSNANWIEAADCGAPVVIPNTLPANLRFSSGADFVNNATSGTSVGSVTADDPNAGDTLSYTVASNNAVTVDANGTIRAKASAPAGTYNLVFTVHDGTGPFTDTLQLVVTAWVDPNTAPTAPTVSPTSPASYGSDTLVFDTSLATSAEVAQLSSTDAQGDVITYGVSVNSAVTISGNKLYVKSGVTSGYYSVTVSATDGALTSTKSFTIMVTIPAGGNAPTVDSIVPDPITFTAGATAGTVIGQIYATDPESQAIIYSISSNSYVTVNSSTGEIKVATSAPVGSGTVTATASDGTKSGSRTFTVTVNAAANDAPIIDSIVPSTMSFTAGASGGISLGQVYAHDPEAGSITYSVAANSYVTINSSTGVVFTKSGVTGSGAKTVQVTVSDGSSFTTGTINLSIAAAPVNTAPFNLQLDTDPISFDEDVAANVLVGTLSASDTGASPTLVTYSINPASGAVYLSGTQLKTVGGAGDGIYSITVTASDGSLSTTENYNITVNAVSSNNGYELVPEWVSGGSYSHPSVVSSSGVIYLSNEWNPPTSTLPGNWVVVGNTSTDCSTITAWSVKGYVHGNVVSHNGSIWVATTGINWPNPQPGTVAQWVQLGVCP